METTGHNLANVNTEGYSRQRVLQQSATPIIQKGVVQGTGARVKSIERIHDNFIEKRLQKAETEKNYNEMRTDQLDQVESLFSEIDKDGLNAVLNKFFNAFRELSSSPENETMRSVVRDTANLVVKDFNRIDKTIETYSRNIDQKMMSEVADVNSLLKGIADLNKKITSLEAAGDETGDLRDQRDLSVRELSKSFKIHSYLDGKNNFIINAVNVGTLVSGGAYQELKAAPTDKTKSSNNMDGSVEIYFSSRPSQPITNRFHKGRLSSLAHVRNNDLVTLKNKVDKIAFDFGNSVNAVHNRGYANRSININPVDGKLQEQDFKGKLSKLDFFNVSKTVEGAALNLNLSKEVLSDLSNIVTASDPNSPGDNQVAIAISKIQDSKIMSDGTATLEEEFLKTIGNIGVEAGKARLDFEQSEGIVAQMNSLRERTSGVSIDEETAKLVKYQHAYQASAKVMQTADEMFRTVLGIKR